MAKAIFTTKVTPVYDDLPEARYHFPKTYLRQVEAVLKDWIIYYEPRRPTGDLSSIGGRQSYFATARVESIIKDSLKPDHYYAFVSNYLEFDRAVPFSEGHIYYESILRKDDGSTNKGAFGRAVRSLPNREYEGILTAGFARILGKNSNNSPETVAEDNPIDDLVISIDNDRPIIQRLLNKPFRDRAFSTVVKSAYSDTCAMTGITIINGGGRSEVQAAHIRPVADQGPDSIRNGIALSSTFHWMFDHGLVSIKDDYTILISKGRLPSSILGLIDADMRLILPQNPAMYPHKQFLSYHRDTVFKG